ncbi:hypothetical protein BCT30_17560 [Enterovibrio norvegicus]|uniref:hypothetical protein n=1 Tax=Enterovibrio norvegicus TaxID=188144 RepID=UPI0003105E69|nr:hypothetical protein [Enterovibrio norvegicus]MCC4796718.1 hypothetical protein [Enterovibrio norvegicus]OEF62721.1 hypothetical protein A1OW_18620 [Enterovibrio norvegicus]PMI37304.1 hypothetical protein BCU46_11725 [Enterovibrio norvegicus]PMN49894.1 hypothetical protein BCT30_17560 [Enterovibrio norvegicus]
MAKNSTKKYPYTKRLVRIALENGYTNKTIAIATGLQESSVAMVSRWRNGESLATDRQMAKLIKEFGHLLKRQISHLFYCYEENTENKETFSYYTVTGERILNHKVVMSVPNNRKVINVSLFRVVVIQHGEAFNLIIQGRQGLHKHQDRCNFKFSGIQHLTHSSNEDAMWNVIANSHHQCVDELIAASDVFADRIQQGTLCQNIESSEGGNLKYVIRQVFIKLGRKPEGIEDLPRIVFPEFNR